MFVCHVVQCLRIGLFQENTIVQVIILCELKDLCWRVTHLMSHITSVPIAYENVYIYIYSIYIYMCVCVSRICLQLKG